MDVIAAVYHWPPSALEGMSLEELMDWAARAGKRWVRPVVWVDPEKL